MKKREEMYRIVQETDIEKLNELDSCRKEE